MPQLPMPQPTMQQATPEIQTEMLRRRAQLGASTTGSPSNSPSPMNPLAQQGLTPPLPMGGAEGFASDAAIQQMKTQKAESEKLVDALVWRLKKISDRGE